MTRWHYRVRLSWWREINRFSPWALRSLIALWLLGRGEFDWGYAPWLSDSQPLWKNFRKTLQCGVFAICRVALARSDCLIQVPTLSDLKSLITPLYVNIAAYTGATQALGQIKAMLQSGTMSASFWARKHPHNWQRNMEPVASVPLVSQILLKCGVFFFFPTWLHLKVQLSSSSD